MDIERPLLWHQGLFLQPQHFQIMERSMLSCLIPFYDFIEPHFWGIGDIDIQKTALGTRTFSILRTNLVFQDGTHAVFPGNAIIEPRMFNDAWAEGGMPFTVYIGIRKWNSNGENVTVVEKMENLSGITTRFISPAEPEDVKDLHSDGPTGQVRRLYYYLRIF